MYNSEDPNWWQNLHRIYCNHEPIDGWNIGVEYIYDSLYPAYLSTNDAQGNNLL